MRTRLAVMTLAAALAATLGRDAAGWSEPALRDAGADAASHRTIEKPKWLRNVRVTEYFPSPEKWFDGRKVKTPGLDGERHRVDWLFSGHGMSMEGDGIGLNGKRYHIANIGRSGWVSENGRCCGYFWRNVGWRAAGGWVTYPLQGGGWFKGRRPKRFLGWRGTTFGRGPSLPLKYYRSLAVDPHLIERGSKVYIPRYKHTRHKGWFIAQDTGGAIDGKHVDVFRPPPPSKGGGNHYPSERIKVVPPGYRCNCP